MHLVLVAQDFPPTVGGIQTYARELAQRLASRCERFLVVAPAHPDARACDDALPFEVQRVGGSRDLFFAAAALRARSFGAEISLHTQWPSAFAALIARARGRRPRICVAAHGRELLVEPWARVQAAQSAYDAARRSAFRHADRVFAVSRYTAELVRAMTPAHGPLHVIGNGTDPERFRPLDASALRAELGLGDAFVFLSVARLVGRKGVDRVVRALAALHAPDPAPHLVIVGDGPERERLLALVRSLGLEQRVHFAGAV
ncbi:MAG TPA: glycosyltransferase, partial [Polyangiales bacterium]|nr:glycosyltransferase [Polyangiales bacterium]